MISYCLLHDARDVKSLLGNLGGGDVYHGEHLNLDDDHQRNHLNILCHEEGECQLNQSQHRLLEYH